MEQERFGCAHAPQARPQKKVARLLLLAGEARARRRLRLRVCRRRRLGRRITVPASAYCSRCAAGAGRSSVPARAGVPARLAEQGPREGEARGVVGGRAVGRAAAAGLRGPAQPELGERRRQLPPQLWLSCARYLRTNRTPRCFVAQKMSDSQLARPAQPGRRGRARALIDSGGSSQFPGMTQTAL